MNMRSLLGAGLLASSVLCAANASAHAYQIGNIKIGHPWARATAPGQSTGGGYLTLANTGSVPDALVSASSPVAKSVELHQMTMDGDVMRMRQVSGVPIAAGQSVEFKPGGYHLMLVGLTQPLKAGDSVPLQLQFEKAGKVEVQIKVSAADAAMPMSPSASEHGAMHGADAHDHVH